jgi:predicted pyridoxine 5'-phosphate oxidase superfamily flavin-nucleotide-binding protein
MNIDSNKFNAAKQAFNTAKIFKGQIVSIATCDTQGNPNTAPIGSMRIVNENTVHVLQGFLGKSLENLENNPKAAFSICLRQRVLSLSNLFAKSDKKVMGYRVYGELVEINDSQEAVKQEYQQLLRRVPWPFKGLFLKFCQKNLKRLLIFKITGMRAIGASI